MPGMASGAVDIVLFDLGGVLIELGGVRALRELADIASDDEVWRRWLTCPWVRTFESGQSSTAEFADGVVPVLQQRGLFRRQYAGTTLRSHLSAS